MGVPLKYVQINVCSDNWADSIVFKKHRELQEEGHESWVFWARGNHDQDQYMCKIASFPEVCFDLLQTRIDGHPGFYSKGITKRLLDRLDLIKPDVVHLHVLLGYYLNIEMLFNWLAQNNCEVIWTMHDCWAFTGHCIYFTYVGCEQWKSGCGVCQECPQRDTYPETFHRGLESENYFKKRELILQIPADRMTLIAPSQWMADLVSESYLSKYRVEVVHNQINREVFKPTASSFRDDNEIGNRCMVLGVASKWSERKGLFDFVKLSKLIDSSKIAIVLVGLSRKQLNEIPSNIIGFEKLSSASELASVYSAADVFFNPTLEDNYPTVNLEAEACGTPVISYDTGGCSETISLPESKIVQTGDLHATLELIMGMAKGLK